MAEEDLSIVRQTERAFDDFVGLWRKRRFLCIVIAAFIAIPVGYGAYRIWADFAIAAENQNLREELAAVRQDRDAKAAQLAPFLAVANQRFAESPDSERLRQLLRMVEQLVATTEQNFSKLPLQRTLPPETSERIVGLLKVLHPMPINFGAVMGDIESFGLAKQLADLFLAAGWPEIKLGYVNANRNPKGIQVLSTRSLESELAPALAEAARQLGLSVDFNVASEVLDPGTWIVVGGVER